LPAVEGLAKLARRIFEPLGLPPVMNDNYARLLIMTMPGVDPVDYGYLPYLLFAVVYAAHLPLMAVVGPAALIAGLILSGVAASAPLLAPQLMLRSMASQASSRLTGFTAILAILSTIGGSIDTVFEKAEELEPSKVLKTLARRITYYIRVLGLGAVEALRRAGELAPLHRVRVILDGVARSIETRGTASEHLMREYEHLIEEKIARMERIFSSLTYMLEAYIIMVVMGPVIILLMVILSAAMGIKLVAIPTDVLLALSVYAYVPFASLGLIIVIDSMRKEVEVI